jgi:hypothetical protein
MYFDLHGYIINWMACKWTSEVTITLSHIKQTLLYFWNRFNSLKGNAGLTWLAFIYVKQLSV